MDSNDASGQFEIRMADAADAERVAVLCHQLGYPSSLEQVRRRLDQIGRNEDQVIYVAVRLDGYVVGWVQVGARQLVVADLLAEIEGLVVDEKHRDRGIGRLLMEQAEQWARAKGCEAVQLRSNVVRQKAHEFYEGIGYGKIKTSYTLRKPLEGQA